MVSAERAAKKSSTARPLNEILQFLDIQHVRHARTGTLPYGLRKRVELARAVALRPSLILLDEPMAGMNHDEKREMARHIVQLNRTWGMTILMIEHDIAVVSDISDRVLVLEAGHCIAFAGPDTVLADPRVHDAYLGPAAMQPAGSEAMQYLLHMLINGIAVGARMASSRCASSSLQDQPCDQLRAGRICSGRCVALLVAARRMSPAIRAGLLLTLIIMLLFGALIQIIVLRPLLGARPYP